MTYPTKITYAVLSSLFLNLGGADTSFAQAGSLDPTFSTDGIVVQDFSTGLDDAHDIAIQSDGKILVAGRYFNGTNIDFTLFRFNTDGTLDLTYNSDGLANADLLGIDYTYALEIQSDHKVVVVGCTEATPLSTNMCIGLVRFNSDGTLDTSFDGDGVVVTDLVGLAANARDVRIQSDGKIVVAGSSNDGITADYVTLRYNPDGSLDNTFDGDGMVITNLGVDTDIAEGLCIQSDGKIIVVGTTVLDFTHSFDIGMVRYNTDGSIDNTFDTDGIVIQDVALDADAGTGIALQTDGKILVSGSVTLSSDTDCGILRFNTDGSLDNTFDSDGINSIDLFGVNQEPLDLAVQADGKIVLVGYHDDLVSDNDFLVARFNTDGSADITFGTDGLVTTDITGTDKGDVGFGIVIQSDGKILATGYTDDGASNVQIVVARYSDTGSVTNQTAEFYLEGFSIFPNPSTGEVNVQWKGKDNVALQVFNSLGQMVIEEQMTNSSAYVLSKKGVYFAKIQNGEKYCIQKIVIQ